MTGKIASIDLSLKNIWQSWFKFKKGKKTTPELDIFQYNLEKELDSLAENLKNETYKHGGYRKFTVCDNKKREISVATIRDRVMHRLIYDYLTKIYDKTFIYDAWSCRKNKGLLSAIERIQEFMKKYSEGYVWKADIKKFFDNVSHEILLNILKRKIKDGIPFLLLAEIIRSFSTKKGCSIPIGNLTSQILSNIYLNELDRYIKYNLKIKAYLRYGDDFLIFSRSNDDLEKTRTVTANFLKDKLNLELHAKNNLIIRTRHGLKFLGLILFPNIRKMNRRNYRRLQAKLNLTNISSYWGIVKQCHDTRVIQEFQWRLLEKIPRL